MKPRQQYFSRQEMKFYFGFSDEELKWLDHASPYTRVDGVVLLEMREAKAKFEEYVPLATKVPDNPKSFRELVPA